jgi:hypothetical protein
MRIWNTSWVPGYRMARSPDKDAGRFGCQNAPAAARTRQSRSIRARV